MEVNDIDYVKICDNLFHDDKNYKGYITQSRKLFSETYDAF